MNRTGSPRVAYVVSRFPAPTETFILNEIVNLCDEGLDVRLYPLFGAASGPRHAGTDAVMQRVTYVPLLALVGAQLFWLVRAPRAFAKVYCAVAWGHRRSWGGLLRAFYTVPRAAWLARELKLRQFRHVHAHWATWPTLAAFVVKRLAHIPYSFTAHAHDLYLDRSMLLEKVEDAQFVITISEFNRKLIGDLCGEQARSKTQVIRCGVDPDAFRPEVLAPEAAEDPLVLCVAGLRDYKGQKYLVEACSQLRRRGERFRCLLVGDGPERKRLSRRVNELGLERQVKLVGALAQDRVRELILRSRVVVHPSVVTEKGMMDGVPVALMEAMSAACAVVSTRVSGIPELVEDGVSGIVVPPADPGALSDAITLILGDEELRARLGRGAREAVLARYTLAKNTRRLYAVLARASATRLPGRKRRRAYETANAGLSRPSPKERLPSSAGGPAIP